jgi:hypothetical protein
MAMLRYPSEKDESLFWRDGGKSKRKWGRIRCIMYYAVLLFCDVYCQ